MCGQWVAELQNNSFALRDQGGVAGRPQTRRHDRLFDVQNAGTGGSLLAFAGVRTEIRAFRSRWHPRSSGKCTTSTAPATPQPLSCNFRMNQEACDVKCVGGITVSFGTCRDSLRSLAHVIFLFRAEPRSIGVSSVRPMTRASVSHATDVESPLTPNRCDYFALLSRVLPENALCRCEVSLFWWQVRAALRHVPGKPSIPISNVFASPSDIRVLMQAS